jgi:hypothetical protein
MIKVTYTGFLVPVKLAPIAVTLKEYRRVTCCLITTLRLTPPITPVKVKDPSGCFVKEPAGMVVVKVPTYMQIENDYMIVVKPRCRMLLKLNAIEQK